MRNGFVRNLVFILAFGAAYFLVLHGRVSQASALLGTVLLALGMCVAADLAWRGARARAKRLAIERSLGGAPFEDGALVAAAGKIEPLGEPLLAPFTTRPCVAFEYCVSAVQGHQMPLVTSLSGVALTPSFVASKSGNARLLGWPGLGSFAESECDDDRQRENARAFVVATRFEVGALSGGFSRLDAPVADAEGGLRIDIASGNDTNPDGKRLTEKVVPAGANVCAIGSWNAARGGIVAAPDAPRVELLPGNPDALVDRLGRSATGLTTAALVVATAVNAIAWTALT